MNDPARWRSSEGGAPSEARELLRHAAAPKAFDAAARARNAAAIAKISAGAVSAPTTVVGAKLIAKVGLAGLLAVTAGVGVQRVREHRAPHAPVAHVVAAPPPVARPVAPPPVEERAARVLAPSPVAPQPVAESRAPATAAPAEHAHVVAHASAAPSRVATHARPSQPTESAANAVVAPAGNGASESSGVVSPHVVPTEAAPEEPLQREISMLGSAAASIDSDPAAALANLDRHAREFPSGQMAPEREFLAVRALLSLHRDAEARTRAEALERRFPSSPYVARVRRLLPSP